MKKIFTILLALYIVFPNISTYAAPDLPAAPDHPAAPGLSAASAIVIDARTGFILYEKNIHEPRYPASIAKIMTALIALEQYSTRLYEPIGFSANAVYSIPPGSSHIAMNAGETLTMEDALYALILSSANEVANAIAEHISGDIESFGELMTRRAVALGAVNTRFTNPSGLHSPDQVTTAYDMALITRAALRHPEFIKLIGTARHDIPPTERQPLVRELLTSNRMIRSGPHFNEHVVGGKTGYTDPARHTLVTYAVRDGRELIAVTLQGEGARLYTDTRELLEYAFAMPYIRSRLFEDGQYARTVPVYSGWGTGGVRHGQVRLVVPDDVYIELPEGFGISEVEQHFYAPARLITPIQAGQNIGRLVYSIRGIRLGDVQLMASNTVLAPVPEEPAPLLVEEPLAEPYSIPLYEPLYGIDAILDNYYYTVILPLTIFIAGLILSLAILKAHRRRRQKGHYSVVGTKYRR